MTTDNQSTKVITGKVRLSYAHVFTPKPSTTETKNTARRS